MRGRSALSVCFPHLTIVQGSRVVIVEDVENVRLGSDELVRHEFLRQAVWRVQVFVCVYRQLKINETIFLQNSATVYATL